MLLQRIKQDWVDGARCVGLTGRGRDWWSPDDDLPADEQGLQHHLARRVCSECPVRLACAMDALAALPRIEEHAMRGGLTPSELAAVAKSLGMKWRREAQHGTRSRYVAGCKCDDCRDAHRVYEHDRRLWAKTRKPQKQIGDTLGVSTQTVSNDARKSNSGFTEQPATRTDSLGRERPTSYAKPQLKPEPRAPEFCGRCWLEVTAVGTCGCDL